MCFNHSPRYKFRAQKKMLMNQSVKQKQWPLAPGIGRGETLGTEKQGRPHRKFCFLYESHSFTDKSAGPSLWEARQTRDDGQWAARGGHWPLGPAELRCQHKGKDILTSEVSGLVVEKKWWADVILGEWSHRVENRSKAQNTGLNSFIDGVPINTGYHMYLLGTGVMKINKPRSVSFWGRRGQRGAQGARQMTEEGAVVSLLGEAALEMSPKEAGIIQGGHSWGLGRGTHPDWEGIREERQDLRERVA